MQTLEPRIQKIIDFYEFEQNKSDKTVYVSEVKSDLPKDCQFQAVQGPDLQILKIKNGNGFMTAKLVIEPKPVTKKIIYEPTKTRFNQSTRSNTRTK